MAIEYRQAAKRILGKRVVNQLARGRTAWELAKPRDFLLVASHMRSYSSLLCHILGSTPEISGYTEMRRTYRAEPDLLALVWQVRSENRGTISGDIVLDKVLHGGYAIEDPVLLHPRVKVLFSVRSPEATLRSIVAMGIGIDPDHKWGKVQVAHEYYLERLEELTALARRCDTPLVLNADSLMTNTDEVLRQLQQRLGLKSQLKGTYTTGSLTGRAEYGDTSDYIASGAVVSERDAHDEVTIPVEMLASARQAHAQFWDDMANLNADVIGSP